MGRRQGQCLGWRWEAEVVVLEVAWVQGGTGTPDCMPGQEAGCVGFETHFSVV